jgi:hypothetical protein
MNSSRNPSENISSPRTFGDLYTEITTKSILTPEEEVELKKRVFEKYGGVSGLLKKRKENITEHTHQELDELLSDLPSKKSILAKLNPYLPGWDFSENAKRWWDAFIKKTGEIWERIGEVRSADIQKQADKLASIGKEEFTNIVWGQALKSFTNLTDTLVSEGKTHGTEVIWAIWVLASAGSMSEASKWIDSLSSTINKWSENFSNAIKNMKELISSFFEISGLGKFFRSIWRFFGMDLPEPGIEKNEKKETVDKNESSKTNIIEALKNPEKTKEIIGKMADKFSDKISTTYFSGQKLSENQLKKVRKIFTESLDPVSIQKIGSRIDKEGASLNVWELLDAMWEVGAVYPTKVMWELSWSGIIPKWAIFQHVVVNPSKNLIALTFDGLWLPVMNIGIDELGMMLHEKAKGSDHHALDMARVQLYGINSIMWKTLGTAIGWVVAWGIMLADTTTGTDGLKIAKYTSLKQYEKLAEEFAVIEKALSKWWVEKTSSDIFKQMLAGIKWIETNSLLLNIVSKNSSWGTLDMKKIVDWLSAQPEFVSASDKIRVLRGLADDPKNIHVFRDALKNMVVWESSTGNMWQSFTREWSQYKGGQTWEITRYIDRIDSVKKWQLSLLWDTGALSEKMKRLALTYESLKIARSADTVHLHLETAEDISKFRAFLSVIPGWIKAIAEILPAASLIISLWSIAYDARDKKEWVTSESLMDVFKTALIPTYWTFGIIRAKTLDFWKMIEKWEVPQFSDIAITGAIGGVFIYEVTRVFSGGKDILQWNITKGLSRLTYMHDIGRWLGQVARWGKNIIALASHPTASPTLTKALIAVAEKIPKKWRLTIGAWILLAGGSAYAYIKWDEKPDEIGKRLEADGLLDSERKPTEKMKSKLDEKDEKWKKTFLDELFMLYNWGEKNGIKTHLDLASGKYSLIGWDKFPGIIDSPFRETLQKLGYDISIVPN